MPIKDDHVTLPYRDPSKRWPDADPVEAKAVTDLLFASMPERDPNKRPDPETPYWASMAGQRCSRQLHYQFTNAPQAPRSKTSEYRMWLGTMVHQAFEKAIEGDDRFVGEQRIILTESCGIPGTGRADLSVRNPEGSARPYAKVIDYKTAGGFPFKLAATTFKGGPNGPSFGAEVQTALAVVALDADAGAVMNLALETLSPEFGTSSMDDIGRFAAQWTFDRARADALVAGERNRVLPVLTATRAGLLPHRELSLPGVPTGATVVDTAKGLWVTTTADGNVTATGKAWPCNYCDYRDQCEKEGPGTAPEVLF